MFRKIKRYLRDPYFALGCDMIKNVRILCRTDSLLRPNGDLQWIIH